MPEFPAVVVVDQREKRPFGFASVRADAREGGGVLTVRTRVGLLPSGDYSLDGLEAEVAVERKSLDDLYGTLGSWRDRFERELERLSLMRFAAVVVESEVSEVIAHPPPRSMLNPKTVVRSVLAWQQRYPRVHWWFCPGRDVAEAITLRILDRFHRDREAALVEEVGP